MKPAKTISLRGVISLAALLLLTLGCEGIRWGGGGMSRSDWYESDNRIWYGKDQLLQRYQFDQPRTHTFPDRSYTPGLR